MLSLLLTALIWGFAFVAQVQGMDSMSPMFFNAARFTLGALSLVPILLWMRGRGSADKGDTAGADVVGTEASVAVSTDAASNGASDVVTITGAKLNANKPDSAVARLLANPVVISVICGIVLFTASTLQQYGILYGKSAGRAGFLTAMYIVMVPLLAFVFLRRRIGMLLFVAVALSIAGFVSAVHHRWFRFDRPGGCPARVHGRAVRRAYSGDRYFGRHRGRHQASSASLHTPC